MIQLNKKIVFILLVITLFFIGIHISDMIKVYNAVQTLTFKDFSPLIPLVLVGGIFFYQLYIKKDKPKQ
ncbi:hypothetical protein [Myroides sp. N17-2]|uniref:hypothetical protein n=1 Tax=Myroides sp. N17-2 TaxID=2030799 RepID=UPI000EFACE94|nr:hypothetical protein [Myroides sp. N17-2]